MSIHTITRGAALVASRLVAFVAGCIFVACAAAVLFEDVALHAVPVSLDHVLTLGVLSGTLLTGHLLMEAWRGRHALAVLGFSLLFAVGTALVVYQSTGKQAAHTFQSQAAADFAEEERARIKPLLEQAEGMLSGTATKINKDCVHGKASKAQCDGLRATHNVYEAAVKGHMADLERLGPPKPVAPEAQNFANLAAVFGADRDMVKAGAVLVVPFIRTVLFELGAIWCFGFAFRTLPRRSAQSDTSGQTSFGASDADIAALAAAIRPDRPAGGTAVRTKPNRPAPSGPAAADGRTDDRRGQVLAFIQTEQALGRTIPRQADIAERFDVPRSTLSDWCREWEADGSIPVRRAVGRCKVIAAV